MAKRPRVTKDQMTRICEELMDGASLSKICEASDLPGWRTVTRHVQEDDDAHTQYRKARAIQAEILRDQIIDIIEAPLPEEPKLAMAEVQRRRLEVDQKDKYVRQLAPLGIRDRAEDNQQNKMSGTITLKWDDSNG